MRAISFILAGWITKFRFWLKNKNKDSIIKKLQPIHALMIIAAGIVAALVTTLILNGLNIIFADTLFMQDYVSVASGYNINEYNIWYALLIMVIIDPLIEELICRVIIGGIIDVIFGIRLFTIISSSMIFSILHEGIVQRVYALIFGVVLSILYYYGPDILKQCKKKKFKDIYMELSNYNNKNLLRNYLFHMGFNLIGVITALISVL